jgi:hypothetical protein
MDFMNNIKSEIHHRRALYEKIFKDSGDDIVNGNNYYIIGFCSVCSYVCGWNSDKMQFVF